MGDENKGEYLFKDIVSSDIPISDFELAYQSGNGLNRLYLNKNIDDDMFHTISLRFLECPAEHDDLWSSPDLIVTKTFETRALCDGVRHLQFYGKDDNAGYFNYPELSDIADMLNIVRKIELEICDEDLVK